ncbi:MAG: hypothetical protein U1E78_06960 [Gammaproteobacteria bacterium]
MFKPGISQALGADDKQNCLIFSQMSKQEKKEVLKDLTLAGFPNLVNALLQCQRETSCAIEEKSARNDNKP